MKLQSRLVALIAFLFVFVYIACNTDTNEPTDTPTSGEVTIMVDESFQKLFETQLYTFHSIYPNAKVNAEYLAEKQALEMLSNDSCKVVVMCRDLTKEERKHFESKNLFPISTKIAEDAIALIVNPENTEKNLTVGKVKAILAGIDTTWKQVNTQSEFGKIQLVFDNSGSANARYMQDTLLGGKTFGKNVFAVKSNLEVIAYVSKNKNAIGFLSVNWISDLDDTESQRYLEQIKVLAIKKTEESDAFKPYQAYIKTKEYPFTRDVYMINRQTRAGLGMGIVSFVAGDKGQLMILKAGLVPAIAPVRLVKVNMEQ
jgi:phosphate transport system substrate-binding protein